MIDINVNVRAIEKLVDYTASGIGSTASFLFSRMVARRDAEVRRITAEGEAEAQRILTEGRATSMQIIAAAQARGARPHTQNRSLHNQSFARGSTLIGRQGSSPQRVDESSKRRSAKPTSDLCLLKGQPKNLEIDEVPRPRS